MCFVVTCWERADLLALVCGVYCESVTFPLVSWVKCGTWLYRFLIFAPLLTLGITINANMWVWSGYATTTTLRPTDSTMRKRHWITVKNTRIKRRTQISKATSSPSEIITKQEMTQPSRYTTLKQRRFNVDATSWRRIDVGMTSFWRHVSTGNGLKEQYHKSGPITNTHK